MNQVGVVLPSVVALIETINICKFISNYNEINRALPALGALTLGSALLLETAVVRVLSDEPAQKNSRQEETAFVTAINKRNEDTAMRRAGWVAWNVVTALSLLLCLATVALWLRSYRVRDMVRLGGPGGNGHTVQSILGRLHMLTELGSGCTRGTTYQADRLSPQAIWFGGMSGYPPKARWRCGFVWQTYDRSCSFMGQFSWTSYRLIVVPYGFPAGVLALAPLAWAAGLRRRAGLLDLMILVAAVALGLALLRFLARLIF